VTQHAALDVGIQLGKRIVKQQNRPAADGRLHRAGLCQAKRQHEEPLLAARAKPPHVVTVQLDREVVPVRPHQR